MPPGLEKEDAQKIDINVKGLLEVLDPEKIKERINQDALKGFALIEMCFNQQKYCQLSDTDVVEKLKTDLKIDATKEDI